MCFPGLGWGAGEAENWDREERADQRGHEYRSGALWGAQGQGPRTLAGLSKQLLWGLCKQLSPSLTITVHVLVPLRGGNECEHEIVSVGAEIACGLLIVTCLLLHTNTSPILSGATISPT